MIQKIMLALEINDEALDKAQAKVDKLIATLQQAEALQAKLKETTDRNDTEQLWKTLCQNILKLHYM